MDQSSPPQATAASTKKKTSGTGDKAAVPLPVDNDLTERNLFDASEHLKVRLDNIDRARSLLKVYEEEESPEMKQLLGSMPKFVVVGAQSAGKSAVLSRISGIKLPSRSSMCTKAVTELRLRRNETNGRTVSVVLHGPIGFQTKTYFSDEDVVDNARITEAIDLAQIDAAKIEKQTIAKKYFVVVTIKAANVPNVTLIDLPGFSETLKDEVEEMVKIQVKGESTIVLQVLRMSWDPESTVGNAFIKTLRSTADFTRHSATVFTCADELANYTPVQLKNRMDALLGFSQPPLFTILGNVEGCDLEMLERITYLGRMNIACGVEALKKQLEIIIEQRMRNQYDHAMEALRAFCAKLQAELTRLSSNSASSVLDKLRTTLDNRLKRKNITTRLKQPLQRLLEKMADELGEIKMRPLSANENPAAAVRNIHEDIDLTFERLRIVRNRDVADPQLIREEYAEDYAEQYFAIMEKYREMAFAQQEIVWRDVFACDATIPQYGERALAELKRCFYLEFSALNCRCKEEIELISLWNRKPNVITYCPDEVTARETELMKGEPDDHINCVKVQAYLDIQRRVIIDASAKQIYYFLGYKAEKAFEEGLRVQDPDEFKSRFISLENQETEKLMVNNKITCIRRAINEMER